MPPRTSLENHTEWSFPDSHRSVPALGSGSIWSPFPTACIDSARWIPFYIYVSTNAASLVAPPTQQYCSESSFWKKNHSMHKLTQQPQLSLNDLCDTCLPVMMTINWMQVSAMHPLGLHRSAHEPAVSNAGDSTNFPFNHSYSHSWIAIAFYQSKTFNNEM